MTNIYLEKIAGGWSDVGLGVQYDYDSGRYHMPDHVRVALNDHLDRKHRITGAKVMGGAGAVAGAALGAYSAHARPGASVIRSVLRGGAGLGAGGALVGYGLASLGNKQTHDYTATSGREPRIADFVHTLAGRRGMTSGAYLGR